MWLQNVVDIPVGADAADLKLGKIRLSSQSDQEDLVQVPFL
jgi:hypothetical protein